MGSFNIPSCNTCSRTPNSDSVGDIYLDKICKNFPEVDQYPRMNEKQSHLKEKQVLQDHLQILKDGMLNYPKTAIIAYLNLNSLSNKITDLRILLQASSFPTAQFHIPQYEIRAPRDGNKCGRGLVEYVEKGCHL